MTDKSDELDELTKIIEGAILRAVSQALEKNKDNFQEVVNEAVLRAEEQTRRETWKYMKDLTGLDVSKPEEVGKIHDVFNYSKGLMDKTNKICDISLTAVTLAIIGSLMTAIGLGIKAMFFK